MGKPLNADHMRHVGGKSARGRRALKQKLEIMDQLQMELKVQGPRIVSPVGSFAEWVGAVVDGAALVAEARREAALRSIESAEAEGLPEPIVAGDVAISAVSADIGRGPWTVIVCACDLCVGGRFVAVDQMFEGRPRHIARAALRRRGEPSAVIAERWVEGIAFQGPVNLGLAKAEVAHPATASALNGWLTAMAALDAGGGE